MSFKIILTCATRSEPEAFYVWPIQQVSRSTGLSSIKSNNINSLFMLSQDRISLNFFPGHDPSESLCVVISHCVALKAVLIMSVGL